MKRALVLALVTGCPEPTAVRCDDDRFCPAGTTCGGSGVCLVEAGACARFGDGAACELDFARGFCSGDVCEPGVEIIGATASYPLMVPVPDVRVAMVGHPEVLAVDTNPNGYFGVVGTPRDTAVVLELTYPDSLTLLTRPIRTFQADVLADAIYGSIPIVHDDIIDAIGEMVDTIIDPSLGLVVGSTFDLDSELPIAGVVVELAGAGCTGPYYFDASGPVPTATATLPEAGVWAFVNCTPGSYQLVTTHPDRSCRAYDADLFDPTAIDVVADRMLFAGRIVCL